MRILAIGVLALVLLIAGLLATRLRHERAIGGVWQRLASTEASGVFEPSMLDGLPEPARRYLEHALAPGAPLAVHVELSLSGTIRLSDDQEPLPMESVELLAPPRGFVWRANVGSGAVRIRGFDRYADDFGEMRWWLYGLVPVASASGPDVTRSAFGRMLGESVLLPSQLLPSPTVHWSAVGDSTAVARIGEGDRAIDLTITVDTEGRLRRAAFLRWNSDAKNGPVGPMHFVMTSGAERTFGPYTIPSQLSAGWSVDGPVPVDDFAFFEATVEDAIFR